MKLAQQRSVEDIIGRVSPPPGIGGIGGDAPTAISNVLTTFIQLVFLVAGLMLLLYLFWGSIDWIMSSGDKDKLERARGKIRDALIGIFILVFVFVLFIVVAGQILGIVDVSDGIRFSLPRL